MVTPTPMKTQVLRNMVMTHGGVWLADSPRATAVALDALEEVGAVEMMTEHFGARPFFSLQKSTLRRSQPEWRLVAWHQDGAFYDSDVRTMNIWIALTPCGGDRPTAGLEIVPKRMQEILPVDGVMSTHSIDYDLVDRIAEETPTVVPSFEPGDALIFDERLLHRTHLPQEMTDVRYALECWFFAPSHATSDYVPLLV
jgi:ectoine hydroxylase-related dioxygenase (phytanoyl-CoA dioxygenase family)